MQDSKNNYFRYRLFFSKGDVARFIGHLDLQALFGKAFKRAGLPVAYSQGFNPHPLMSIAVPLPLGMAGRAEIFEIYLTKKVDESTLLVEFNKQLPLGLEIHDVVEVPPIGKSAAALAHLAKYHITFKEFAKSENLSLPNEIEEKVKSLNFIDEKRLEAVLATGSAKNLKPQVLLQHLNLNEKDFFCERIEIYL